MEEQNKISLPQLSGRFSFDLPQEQVLIVAGGRAPHENWLRSCASRRRVWCADRGIAACRRAQLVPDALLGDQDSGSSEDWKWAAESGSRIAKFPCDKDWTDLQLVLQEIGSVFGAATAIVSGCFGGRFDHAWANAASLIWSKEWGIRGWILADEQELLVLLPGPAEFTVDEWTEPAVISLLPLAGPCSGVTMCGGHWALPSDLLLPTRPATICNRPQQGKLPSFGVQEGWLGIYFAWDACQDSGPVL